MADQHNDTNYEEEFHISSAREIWEAVRLRYGTTDNISPIFDLKAKLWEVKHNQRSINDYYLEKNDLWKELDFC